MSSKRFIYLSASEIKYLESQKKRSSVERERDRAHALLLSSRGYSMDSITSIFNISRDTVTSWFNRWEDLGVKGGLSDAPKSGRPTIFSSSEQKK